jgi:hypothetical protein
MERHTKCRNPIRSVAVGRQGRGDDTWYHPDCWASLRQEKYEQQVKRRTSLLAPYISGAPAGAAAEVSVGGPPEQYLPDVEQRQG